MTMSQECRLSDKSQAAVTLYITAFITVVSTITDPTLIESFMMAWIAWFPPIRGAAGVVIYTANVVNHLRVYLRSIVFGDRSGIDHLYERTTEANVLVHVVWWIWHIYIPLSQWSWFVEHRQTANAGVFFYRGTAVGVALVGMSFDHKARVIRATGIKLGTWAALLMCLLSFVTRSSLVGLMCIELIMAATKSRQVILSVIYIIFSIIWGSMSYIFIQGCNGDPGEDGFMSSIFIQGRDDDLDEGGLWNVPIFFRPISGLFFACFTCTIAFIVYGLSSASNGLSIGAYLKCSPVGRAIRSVLF
jgi:hypothetical protein